jgi:hypothetical protein
MPAGPERPPRSVSGMMGNSWPNTELTYDRPATRLSSESAAAVVRSVFFGNGRNSIHDRSDAIVMWQWTILVHNTIACSKDRNREPNLSKLQVEMTSLGFCPTSHTRN